MKVGAGGRGRHWLTAALGAASVAVLAACGTTSSGSSSSGASSNAQASTSGASGSTSASGQKLKVAFVYQGTVDNQGWDTAMDAGRQELLKELGDKVETTYKQGVADGPQDKTVLEQLIADGNKLIFTTSFGQQTAVLQLAAAHPDVKFVQVTALKTAPNVAGFDASAVEGFYVAGMAAAAAAKAPKIGLVGGFPLTNQLAQLNAFTLGAQAVNPAATVQVVWTNDWDSLAKAQNAAQGLVDSGIKALTQFTTGPGIAPVAKATDTPWVGFEVDQKSFAPQPYLTSVQFNWGPYFVKEAKAVLDGTWKSDTFYGNMSTGTVQLAPWGAAYDALDQATKSKIQTAMDAFKSGTKPVFVGPLKDRGGKVQVPAGKTATAAEIATMSYVVPGVLGSVPKL